MGGRPKPTDGKRIDACIHCGKGGVRVTDSRPGKNYRRRSRRCPHCHGRWTTLEMPVQLARGLLEIKKSLVQAMAAIDIAMAAVDGDDLDDFD